jgi:hypothetical protein
LNDDSDPYPDKNDPTEKRRGGGERGEEEENREGIENI